MIPASLSLVHRLVNTLGSWTPFNFYVSQRIRLHPERTKEIPIAEKFAEDFVQVETCVNIYDVTNKDTQYAEMTNWSQLANVPNLKCIGNANSLFIRLDNSAWLWALNTQRFATRLSGPVHVYTFTLCKRKHGFRPHWSSFLVTWELLVISNKL